MREDCREKILKVFGLGQKYDIERRVEGVGVYGEKWRDKKYLGYGSNDQEQPNPEMHTLNEDVRNAVLCAKDWD